MPAGWKVECLKFTIRCSRTAMIITISLLSVLSVYNLVLINPLGGYNPLHPPRSFIPKLHDFVNISLYATTVPPRKANLVVLVTRKKITHSTPKKLSPSPILSNNTAMKTLPSASKEQHQNKKSAYKLILHHMIPRWRKHGPDSSVRCGKYKCITSTNRSRMAIADAIIVDIFLLSRTRSKDKPERTSPDQAYIFFAKEPWDNYKELFPKAHWDGVFNWTLTYQRNSDFSSAYGQIVPNKNFNKTKYDWDGILKNKTNSIFWLVSNCGAGSLRHKYVDELKKHMDVDIVGKCGRKHCVENSSLGVEPCYRRSRFYLSFESRLCQDYVTEKFFRTFGHHIVPIVRGKTNYSSLCPPDLYINTADYASPAHLVKYLKYLESNSTAYLGYLQRRARYRASSVGTGICGVCKSLHELDSHRKSYSSISEWFSTCETPLQPHLHK